MPGKSKPEAISIVANGSKNAFVALKGGTADIGMASRQINDAEVKSLSPINMKLPTTEIVIGMDGIAIVVNQANPVRSLTRQQVAQIFRGEVTNWSEFGGANQPIAMYGRNKDSGTWSTFVEDVLGNKKESYSTSVVQKSNGEEIAATVAKEPGGVGYVSIAQIKGVNPLALSDGQGTQALTPGPFTVATDDYILSRRLYLYLAKQSDIATEFTTFVQSPEGQNVVKQVGFVQQVGDFETVVVPSTAPQAYKDIAAGRKRMTLNFRFETNSDRLENKALTDLARAVRGLAKVGIKDVYLLGFADSVGSYDVNMKLSIKRAQVVADRLEIDGIHSEVAGFSYEMPLAVDKDPSGKPLPAQQKKNRRVELWAKI
jgi:phosphate transport system substrate-binding protein